MVVKQAPRRSATARALDPASEYTHELELLRSIEHSTRWQVWSKTRDGASGRRVPQPVRFPWEPKPEPAFRADPIPIEQMAALLGWPAPKVVSNGAVRR